MLEAVKLRKVKRPGGVYDFEVDEVGDDEHGVWLHGAPGARWTAPHDAGTLDFAVLVLVAPDRPFVAWWVDDPHDRRIEIDVCCAPSRVVDGWEFVDLELDPTRHESGVVVVHDRDEFEVAVRDGWMSPADATLAERTARECEAALVTGRAPFGDEGWQRLRTLDRDA